MLGNFAFLLFCLLFFFVSKVMTSYLSNSASKMLSV